jgi:ABC-2 type transport system ATP-binding protein
VSGTSPNDEPGKGHASPEPTAAPDAEDQGEVATGDEAAGDEAAGDEAAGDEAAGDEAAASDDTAASDDSAEGDSAEGDSAGGDSAEGDSAEGDSAVSDDSAEGDSAEVDSAVSDDSAEGDSAVSDDGGAASGDRAGASVPSEPAERLGGPLVVVQDLVLGGSGGRKPLRLARWELRPGVTGLVGPSGVGKTTLCEVLLGLDRARGQVQVLGHWLPKAGPRVRSEVGYLAQDLAVYPGMTALEFATFVGEAHTRWRGKRVFERLARYQVPTRIPVEQLAPRARAFLAMTLALGSEPKLVIADLPTCLDGGARADLLEALLGERGESSLLIATARPHELEGRCREVLFLGGSRGEVLEGHAVAEGLWRLDLRGDARPPLDPGLSCLQAGPGPSGARWIVAGDESLLPRDPSQVSSVRPATYEEAALARLSLLQTAPPT